MKKQMLLVAVLVLSTSSVLPMEEQEDSVDPSLLVASEEQKEKEKEGQQASTPGFLSRFLGAGQGMTGNALTRAPKKETPKEKKEGDDRDSEEDIPVVVPTPCTYYVVINPDGSRTLYETADLSTKIGDVITIKQDRFGRDRVCYYGMPGESDVVVEPGCLQGLEHDRLQLRQAGNTIAHLADRNKQFTDNMAQLSGDFKQASEVYTQSELRLRADHAEKLAAQSKALADALQKADEANSHEKEKEKEED